MPHPIPNFHDARLSLIQSAVRHCLCNQGELRPGLCADHPAMQAANAHLAVVAHAGPQPLESIAGDCLKMIVEYALALMLGDETWQEQIASEYEDSSCDPGWLSAVADYVTYYWVDRGQPLYNPQGSVYPLPASASGDSRVVGVLGDWGTGEPVAIAVLESLFSQQPDVIVHVGDVYYAGTEEEAVANFLQPIQQTRALFGVETPVYTIPGNHDYYSGGAGFYDKLLPALNPAAPQTSSFFSLENDGWLLQFMDTGYYDHDLLKVGDDITHLHPAEAAWHQQRIGDAIAAGKNVLLFSHHQLFSPFLNIGPVSGGNEGGANFNPALLGNFAGFFSSPRLLGWFWGHEHVLAIYPPYQDLAAGRLVGDSAFPVFADDGYTVKFPQVPWNDQVQLAGNGVERNHGYTVLKLSSQGAAAEYWSVPVDAVPGKPVPATCLFSELLPSPPGSTIDG